MTLKVTIDSSDPLTNSLRVVSAMYDVSLAVSTEPGRPAPAATRRAPSSRGRQTRPGAASKRRKSSKKTTAPGASNTELRSWATQNGYSVSERGRVPAAVIAAYREAHPPVK